MDGTASWSGSHPNDDTEWQADYASVSNDHEDESSDSEEEAFPEPVVPHLGDMDDDAPLPPRDMSKGGEDEDSESDEDWDWEKSPLMYNLKKDEVQTSWQCSRLPLPSLFNTPRDNALGSSANASPSDDSSYVFVPSNPERSANQTNDEDGGEPEDEEREVFDWVVPMGQLRQEEYTWEQRHPRAARVLNIAENLPYVQEARQASTKLTERAQPYVDTARETFNNTAAKATNAAKVANELAIVTGQVTSWLAGEATQAVRNLAPVVQNYVAPRTEDIRQRAVERVAGGWGIAQFWIQEYMRAVEPVERPFGMARGHLARRRTF